MKQKLPKLLVYSIVTEKVVIDSLSERLHGLYNNKLLKSKAIVKTTTVIIRLNALGSY